MADGAVTIEIKGDSKDFEVNISNTAKKVNGLKSALHGAKSGESDLAGGAKKAAGELGGLKSVLKGIGTAVVVAFSVRAIAGFAKECIDLGSAVAEVQNVVDVAFGSMGGKMEAFAKDSITSFGMSELAAKQTGSTYMAMAKGMGVAEDAASDMAIALTGLSGDVASFFNIDQAEAAEKLKSVFTGETETLKSLGVVMTEANLKQYALAHGMSANISAMSQAERVALNYSFVMDSLSLAQGDFARTQDSWANQTRILSMQWQQLMATLGQCLTTVLLPVVKALNSIMAAALQAANAISAAFSQLFGGTRKEFTAAGDSAGAIAQANADIGSSAGSAAQGEKELAKGTKEAAKAAEGALAGFDELNTLQAQSAEGGGTGSSGTGSGTGGAGGGLLENVADTGEAEGAAGRLSRMLEALRETYETLRKTFMAGFTVGWGDAGQGVKNIQADLGHIGQSLRGIFTDPAVTGAAENFVRSTTYALGQLVGAGASVGVSIGKNLVGGIAEWLESSKGFISNSLVRIFDASAFAAELTGNFGQAVAQIFTSLGSDSGKSFTGGLIGSVGNLLLGAVQTIQQLLTLVLVPLFQPIIENADKIREAFTNVFAVLSPILDALSSTIAWLFEQLNSLYEAVLLPLAKLLGGLLSGALGALLDAANAFAPVLAEVSEKFEAVVGKVRELCEAIAERLQPIWQTIMEWLQNVFRPLWDSIFSIAGAVIQTFVGVIGTVLSVAMDLLGGIIDFLTNIFKGDWSGAWESVKSTVLSVWTTIKNGVSNLLHGLGNIVSSVWNGIKTAVTGAVQTVWAVIKTTWDTIYTNVSNVLTGLFNIFSSIWSGIVDTVSSAAQAISGWIGGVIDSLSGAASAVGGFFSGLVGGGSTKGGAGKGGKTISGGFFLGPLPDLAASYPRLPVPALARGAVIPPNREFMAVLGDQRNGTNIEAPLATIQEAVRVEMEPYIDAMMAGFESVVAAIQNKDSTVYIGDESIGRAAIRYQNKMKFVRGGNY